MSRPVSVEELIDEKMTAAKPRFLSKKQRSKLKASKQVSAQVKRSPSEDSPVSAKKRQHKGVAEWTPEEESSDYTPLVTLEVSKPKEVWLSDTHWSEKPLDKMTARDWRIFKDDFSITSKGGDIPNPLRLWSESGLPQKLVDIVENKLGYKEPTPIQRAAIPLALKHRDVVGIAETGSGKTLSFLLPLLTYISGIEEAYLKHEHTQEGNSNKALALVLAPTRELALQISAECVKFTSSLGLTVVTIIGGHQYEETVHSLRNGVHIVVATPGRLIDSLERGIISLEMCYHLVMDEADKMIDMGFEKSLQQIMEYLPKNEKLKSSLDGRILGISKRTTLMFTATILPAIEAITKNYLENPGYLFIGSANEVVDNITQRFEYVDEAPDKQSVDSARFNRMVSVMEKHRKDHRGFSIIIFANYKRIVEQLAEDLAAKGFGGIGVIHGSKSQEARERAIASFRNKETSILVATDVAARGLDVPHVSLVVNYQMTGKFEEYVHRIGRTGRAGQHGESFTFVDRADGETFPELRKFLSRGGYKIPDWLQSVPK